ncbi:MAG: hypothetical protein ACXVKA_04320 [Acidimicrobiia bacterium]
MNEPPMLPTPPFGDATDEALSAVLDGELGAFAAERGRSEASVRAQLEEWPSFEARLAELERARGLVGDAPPPLDDVTRRRLVRNALDAAADSSPRVAPRSRSRSWLTVVAVAAAGLLVVAGIGAGIAAIGNRDSSSEKSASSAATGATAPLRGDVGDLGDVTSPAALRALLDRRAAAAERGASTTAPAGSPPDADRQFANGAPSAPATVSAAGCAQQLAGTRDVTFSGTGTYQGAPVTIVGITEGGRTIVFVVSSTDCTRVLASISR